MRGVLSVLMKHYHVGNGKAVSLKIFRVVDIEPGINIFKGSPRRKLGGIDNVDEAKTIVGKMLYMDRDDVELPEGVNFIQDLIGLEVRDADTGKVYGKVTDIYQHGAADVYELKTPDGKELMFPAIPEVLLEKNIDDGYLVIRPLDGLFDEE